MATLKERIAALEQAATPQAGLAERMRHPEARAKLEQAIKARAGTKDPFLTAFYAVKGKMPAKAPVKYVTLKPGERSHAIDERTGLPTGQVIEGPAKEARPATGLAGQIQEVQAFADENDLSFDEAAAQLQRRGFLRAPNKFTAGGGGGPAKVRPPSAAEMKRIGDEAENDTAARAGLRRDKGRWVTSDGKPASPDMLGMLAKVRAAALAHAENEIRAGRRPSGTAATEAGRSEAGDPAPAAQRAGQFTQGQVYVNAKGERAKYGGRDANGRDIWLRAQ